MNLYKVRREIALGTIADHLSISVAQKDITAQQVEAIVNVANEDLWHGGGIAGAISRKGGPVIQNESRAYVKVHGRVPITHCAYTGAGNLPSKYVLHSVAPKWDDSIDPNLNISLLCQTVKNVLRLANEL